MKRTVLAIFSSALILTLSACGSSNENVATVQTANQEHTHEWVDATCVTPKTCSICGETDGEALGHTWLEKETICTAPKTCSVCGETGEAGEHDLSKSYDGKCQVCGMQVGTPLTESNINEYLNVSFNQLEEGERDTLVWVEVTITPTKENCEYHYFSPLPLAFYSGRYFSRLNIVTCPTRNISGSGIDEHGYWHGEIQIFINAGNGQSIQYPKITDCKLDGTGYVIE